MQLLPNATILTVWDNIRAGSVQAAKGVVSYSKDVSHDQSNTGNRLNSLLKVFWITELLHVDWSNIGSSNTFVSFELKFIPLSAS